jgi:hypothetical protein
MADFAGTAVAVSGYAPFGGHPGELIFTINLAAAAYGGGNLNLSAVRWPPMVTADMVKAIFFEAGSPAAAYMVSYLHSATPTFANLGTLKLFTATGAELSGSVTLTVRGVAFIHGASAMH